MQKKVSKVRNVFMMFTPDICPGIEAKGLKTLLRLPFARFQYRHLCLKLETGTKSDITLQMCHPDLSVLQV
jgi:hypothetical protein